MDSDNEMEETVPAWKGVTGTVILINAYDPRGTTAPEVAYKAACELVRNLMRGSNSQLLGICYYGTDSDSDLEGVKQVFPLCVPTLDDFKALQNSQITSVGQAKDLKMADALWHTNKLFTNCKKLLATKNLILLTNLNAAPVQSDQKPTLKRVVDLVDSDVKIKIVNLAQDPDSEVDSFYNIFLSEVNKGSDEFELPNPIWEMQEVVKSIQSHSHRNLAVAHFTLDFADKFSIGVSIYKLLHSNIKPRKVIADKKTNQIAARTNTTMKVQYNSDLTDVAAAFDDNGMEVDDNQGTKEVPLLKSELLYYQMFGEERVEFTTEEMNKLRNPFGPPSLKLLGFKPASTLRKEQWFMKSCHFLYPSEKDIEGSTVAFKALHQACTEMSVVAICVLCTRVNSRPKIVALLPCTKPLGLEVEVGFDIIPIPFVENVKNVPKNEECPNNIDQAQKQVINNIMNGLQFDFNPQMFENPCLQTLHRAIEALALNETDVEQYTDTTRRPAEVLNSVDSEVFEEVFGQFGATAAKRPAASKTFSSHTKKEKTEEIDEILLSSHLNSRQIEKYTVNDLKQILRVKGIPNIPALTGLKKNELVKLVYENIA